jgi:hypothetical protein
MSNIYCGHCVRKTLSVNPKAFSGNSIEWTNLLEQGVSKVCPSCGIIYSVAKIVANSPQIPKEAREIASVVCGMLLLFAGAIYVDKLIAKLA